MTLEVVVELVQRLALCIPIGHPPSSMVSRKPYAGQHQLTCYRARAYLVAYVATLVSSIWNSWSFACKLSLASCPTFELNRTNRIYQEEFLPFLSTTPRSSMLFPLIRFEAKVKQVFQQWAHTEAAGRLSWELRKDILASRQPHIIIWHLVALALLEKLRCTSSRTPTFSCDPSQNNCLAEFDTVLHFETFGDRLGVIEHGLRALRRVAQPEEGIPAPSD